MNSSFTEFREKRKIRKELLSLLRPWDEGGYTEGRVLRQLPIFLHMDSSAFQDLADLIVGIFKRDACGLEASHDKAVERSASQICVGVSLATWPLAPKVFPDECEDVHKDSQFLLFWSSPPLQALHSGV